MSFGKLPIHELSAVNPEVAVLWVTLSFRLLVGIILIVAGWAKSRATSVFAKVLLSFGVPKFMNDLLAKTLPWLELLLGFLLIIGVWPRVIVIAAAGLLLVFSLALGFNLLRGNEVECGCFGSHSSKISWRLVIRNAFLILLLCIVYVK